MITIILLLVFVLIISLIMMVILPIASVLAIPVLIDAVLIIGLIKIFSHKKDKNDNKEVNKS